MVKNGQAVNKTCRYADPYRHPDFPISRAENPATMAMRTDLRRLPDLLMANGAQKNTLLNNFTSGAWPKPVFEKDGTSVFTGGFSARHGSGWVSCSPWAMRFCTSRRHGVSFGAAFKARS